MDRKVKNSIKHVERLIEEAQRTESYRNTLKNIAYNLALALEWEDNDESTESWLDEMFGQVLYEVFREDQWKIYYPDGDDMIEPEEARANAIAWVKENL